MADTPKIKPLFPAEVSKERLSPAAPAVSPADSAPKPKPLFAPVERTVTETGNGKASVLNLPGLVIRHRLEVSMEELRAGAESFGDLAFARGIEIIKVVDIDHETPDKFANFGVSAQEQFALLSKQVLDAAASPLIEQVRAQLVELRDLIANQDQARFHALMRTLARWGISALSKDSARDVRNRAEMVRTLADKIRLRGPEICRFRVTIEGALQAGVSSSLAEVEALLLAGRFLCRKLGERKAERACFERWVDTLSRRLESLTLSRLALTQSHRQVMLMIESLLNFESIIQDALLTLVPAWYGACTSALSAKSATQSGASLDALQAQILSILKKETE